VAAIYSTQVKFKIADCRLPIRDSEFEIADSKLVHLNFEWKLQMDNRQSAILNQ